MNRREPVRIWVWGDGETWAGWSQKRMNDASTPYLRESAAILRECPKRECDSCRQVKCGECGRWKKPVGRDSMDNGLCDQECPNWYATPLPPRYWPGEQCPDCANGCGECLRCLLSEAHGSGWQDAMEAEHGEPEPEPCQACGGDGEQR